MNKTTIVTGIWNIKRDTLSEGWSRTFEHYINNLKKLLKTPNNMIIYIEKEYEHIIWEHREKNNTMVIIRELDWFTYNGEIYNNIIFAGENGSGKTTILDLFYSFSSFNFLSHWGCFPQLNSNSGLRFGQVINYTCPI